MKVGAVASGGSVQGQPIPRSCHGRSLAAQSRPAVVSRPMTASDFRYAHEGKIFKGTVDFVAEAEVVVPIRGPGVSGIGNDYAIPGFPIVPAQDTITIATAVDAEKYSATVRGKKYEVTAGASSTPGTIRALLKTALDAGA